MKDVSHVFSALSIQNRGIQRAAYEVLHRVIPKTQEAVSFDVALSKAVVSLPDELLSLLLETPNVDVISEQPEGDDKWMDVRCYLLSWKTVFDHFMHAVKFLHWIFSGKPEAVIDIFNLVYPRA